MLKPLSDYKTDVLTPVEEYNGILYKRDDKYMPFSDVPLSGGKVRQAITLLHNNYDYIKNQCGNHIVTPTSVHSPQGLIVSRIAKEFGIKSTLVLGATTREKAVRNNKIIASSVLLGSDIDTGAGMAYNNVLNSRIEKMAQSQRFFIVQFGINLTDNPRAIVDSIAYQVQNIPNDLDMLVMPVGSGITFGGVLRGLEIYNIRPKKIIAIQIAGHDRTRSIDFMQNTGIEYEYIPDKTYAYSKHVSIKLNQKEYLDPIYEAKAFDYMIKHIDIKGKKVLFWIVGNSSFIR